MKYQQAKFIVGHVTIHIKGQYPERFFERCAVNGIVVMGVKKTALDRCVGTIYLHDLNKVKSFIQKTPYEILTVEPIKGLRPKITRLWRNKTLLIAIGLCAVFLFILANIAWKMEVSGVSEETEKQIREKLELEGLYEGAWTFNTIDIDTIQQHVLHELPGLMYIGIHKNGTTFHIDAIEKKMENPPEELPNRDLVASKNGEIQSIFVKNGIGKVAVHDMVKKGDLLVSGVIENDILEEEKEEDEEDKAPPKKVPAEGEIYANTWYEMDVTSSLMQSESSLTGETYQRFHVNFFDFTIPVWGFKQPFSNYLKEEKTQTPRIFNHTMPIGIETKTYHEMTNNLNPNTKEQTRERAINHIEKKLKRKSGEDAEILYYKVLHERLDNGKVKMNLYVSVLEDIAQSKEIK